MVLSRNDRFMNTVIPEKSFDFLKKLKENNSREWMQEHKPEFLEHEEVFKNFYAEIESGLDKWDKVSKTKVYRIYRDLRFSADKTPYNVHRSASFLRAGAHRRGSYYLRLQPGNSLVAGGFFNPNPVDLLRIRKEFEMDSSEIKDILEQSEFAKAFGAFITDSAVKTAPKGFDPHHDNIDLIKLKKFVVRHHFTDEEVFSDSFGATVLHHFNLLLPFFDYMSSVLTTDLNGVSLLEGED